MAINGILSVDIIQGTIIPDKTRIAHIIIVPFINHLYIVFFMIAQPDVEVISSSE